MRFGSGSIALLFLVFTSVAAADDAAPLERSTMFSVADPDNVKIPFPFVCTSLRGNVSLFAQMAPADAIRGHENQATILELKISQTGSIEGAVTIKGSMDSELNRLAMNCTKSLTFAPTMHDGAPVPSLRTWVIFWISTQFSSKAERFSLPAVTVPVTSGAAHTCEAPSDTAGAAGSTRVNFVVGADGRTGPASMVVGSGNAALDAAALRCVGQWQFRPATIEGNPVAMIWTESVTWETSSRAGSSYASALQLPGRSLMDCVKAKTPALSFDAIVAANGTTKDLIFADGSKNDAPTLNCLKNVHYTSPTKNGVPEDRKISVNIHFE